MLPPLAIKLIAQCISQARRDFTEQSIAALSSRAQSEAQPMDTRDAPLTKKQLRRAQQKALLREIQEHNAHGGLPPREELPMRTPTLMVVRISHLLSRMMIVRTSHNLIQSMLPPRYSSSPSVVGEFTKTLEAVTETRDVLSTVSSPQYLALLTHWVLPISTLLWGTRSLGSIG